MSFKSLGLSNNLVTALADQKIKKPYPIQKEAIPAILKGSDLLGIAKTGSGKTASYVLPILMNLRALSAERNRNVDVLVLVPTRELALQVNEVFRTYAEALPEVISSKAVFGGVSINPQMKGLMGVNILVATPGRLLELSDLNAISLSKVDTLVLDEADKMLGLGFEEEMNKIFALLPKKKQNLLFSATLNDHVEELNRVLLNNPEVIKIDAEEDNIDLIDQSGFFVEDVDKGPLLRYLIKSQDLKQVLVFTSSVFKADNVTKKLKKHGISAKAIHSKKTQGSRFESLKDFKEGKINVLVATDLLARGIDIEFLPCVINYELPRSPKDYIHRIGRTGRAENPGKAITFVSEEDRHHFKVIQKKMGKWVTLSRIDDFELK